MQEIYQKHSCGWVQSHATTHRVKNTKLTLYGYEPLQKLHCKSSPQREVSGASKRRDGERRRTWSQVMSHNKVSAARRCSQTILGVPADSSLLTRNTVKVGGLAEKTVDCWKLQSDLPKSLCHVELWNLTETVRCFDLPFWVWSIWFAWSYEASKNEGVIQNLSHISGVEV